MYVEHWTRLKEYRFRFIFYRKKNTLFKRGKSKNTMFIFNRILTWHWESSRYIPRGRSHMRTTELELNSGAFMAPKDWQC